MSPIVSIIVPVYNAELYIRRCISSILDQSYRDYELLLVDDGSNDSSGAICDEYVHVDSRIRVFHQINKGVVSARLFGVKHSTGRWIVFVDADDQLLEDSLGKLVNISNIHNCDVIKSAFIGFPSGKKWLNLVVGKLDRYQFINALIIGRVFGVMYASAYRRDIFSDSLFKFDPTLKIGEDVLMNIEIAKCISSAYVLNECIYQYNDIDGSAMNKMVMHPEYHLRYFAVLRDILRNVDKKDFHLLNKSIEIREQKMIFKSVLLPEVYMEKSEWKNLSDYSRSFQNKVGFNLKERLLLLAFSNILTGKVVKLLFRSLYNIRSIYKKDKICNNKIVIK